MSAPRRIWVTRTRPQAETTAERLRAMGLEPVVAPLLEARALSDVSLDLSGADAIAFTSGHAVRAFAALCEARSLPVFAVGEATAAMARAAGFTDVRAGRGDVSALARTIAAATPKPALVLNPTAREPAADLAALLRARGVQARSVVVYETVPSGLREPPQGVDAVLIHSPRAARMLANLVTPDQARGLRVFAISAAAAAPLTSPPFANIALAPFPDEAGLLNLLEG